MDVFTAGTPHLAPLTQLFDRYRQYFGKPSDLALAERFVAERLRDRDTLFFVATVGDTSETREAAGFAHLFPSFSTVSATRILLLNDLYVVAHQRGKGVGRALLRRAREYAVRAGYAGIKLETQESNQIGQTLYESEGYRRLNGFYQYFLTTPSR